MKISCVLVRPFGRASTGGVTGGTTMVKGTSATWTLLLTFPILTPRVRERGCVCHTTVCDVAPVVPCPGYMSAVPLSAPCGHVAAMIGAAVVVGRALVPALGRRRARPVFRCGLTVTTPVLVLRSAVASGLSPVLLLPRRVCAAGLARAAFPVGFQSGSSFAFAVRRRGAAAGTEARAFARV